MSFKASETETMLEAYSVAYDLCGQRFKTERWTCPMPEEIRTALQPLSLTTLYPTGTFFEKPDNSKYYFLGVLAFAF